MHKGLRFLILFVIIGLVAPFAPLPSTELRADNPPISSVYDGLAAPGPINNPSPIPCVGGETAALIQDNVPWYAPANQDPLGANVTELKARSIKFCIVNSKDIGTTNLTQFSDILISSAQTQTFYNNLFSGGVVQPALTAYVQQGGILSANLTDYASGPGAGGNWFGRSFVGGLTHVLYYSQDNAIAGSSSPIISGQFGGANGGGIVDTGYLIDLDGWNYSSHGYFTNLPSTNKTILVDYANRPVMIEYSFGNGKVIATLTTIEWRYVGGFGSYPQNRKLLANEIGYQGSLAGKTLNVPLFKQTSLPWRDDPYGQIGKTDPNIDIIARWGCFLTSWSMILDFYGSRYGFDTNPRELNNWLRENGGYKERLLIPAKVTEYALRRTPIPLLPPRMKDRDDRKLGDLLTAGIPVDVRVQNQYGEHHVLTVSETTSGGSQTWFINDPLEDFSTLKDGYNNWYDLMQWAGIADGPAQFASVTLMLGSPAELLVIDPQGRRTGMDPRIGIAYNEIPDAIYFVDSLADDMGTGQIAKPVKVFYWPTPLDGGYTIQVIGSNNGSYTLDILNYGERGDPASAALSGTTKPASMDEYRMDYSSAPGAPVTIRRNVRIDIKPGSYPNSINLGSGGTVPVAILSTPTFDATKVDPTTVTLAGASVTLKGRGTPMASFQDVNGDGVMDLVVHVSTDALQLSEVDAQTILDGQTFDGPPIRGTDSVRIVP